MRLTANPAVHLTYCLNVHPGESWSENLEAIREKALAVRRLVAPDRAFGLGLRLSARAAEELHQPAALAGLRSLLAEHDLYAFTINGFPYGRFHDAAVKEGVYRPDWRTEARRDYTIRLIDILAGLLPEGVAGSISTVPGSYKAWVASPADVELMSRRLAEAAAHACRVRQQTGRHIAIALEPEPDCFLQTTCEAVAFLTGPFGDVAGSVLRDLLGVSPEEARRILAEHVGVCFDAAHAAVQFEDLADSLRLLRASGVRVHKVHVSSALRLKASPAALSQLRDFVDPVYLHQVRIRRPDGTMAGFPDLPKALEGCPPDGQSEWRVHFHVPLFFAACGELESTSGLLMDEVLGLLRGGLTEHLEIETYTYHVLPAELRATGLTRSIAREFHWLLERLR